MKKSKKIILVFVAIIGIIVVGGSVYWFSMPIEQRNMVFFMMDGGDSYDNYQEYQVVDRNNEGIDPTSFEPFPAATTEADNNSNIAVVTGMLKNEDSKMVKKAMVQPMGNDDYTGWQLVADEGFEEGVDAFGPSPLSYYTSGLAANLHTQILSAAEVEGVELDSVKVEVLSKFHWEEMLTPDGAGFLDNTTTNIIIESSASEESIQAITDMAINSWAAGEALRNETVIEPSLVINGNNWENRQATPGTSLSDESFVDGFRLSYITDEPMKSEYIDQAGEDLGSEGFDAISNLKFEILAVSESVENSERPNLKKVTVSFNEPTSETWELYSDEFDGDNDSPVAPTSLEYFTAGTSLCLTSQTTLVSSMLGLDYTNYRIESQIDYRQEAINTTEMVSYADTVHSFIVIESDESKERLETFYSKSFALCFAGEGLKGATDMYTNLYLNGDELK